MKTVFILSLFLIVAACSGNKETIIKEIQVVNERNDNPLPIPKSQNNNKPSGGVDDGGGGVAVKGRPLESYAVNITGRDEYQKYIVAIIQKLKVNSPELSSELIYLSRERTWYIIDVPLNEIPRQVMGTYFKTDQVAVQNKSDIWMNQNLFESMSEENRAMLILHELMMGVKILNYGSPLDKCFAVSSLGLLEADLKDYELKRKKCLERYKLVDIQQSLLGGNSFSVSSEDYGLIRKLTKSLFEPESDLFHRNLDLELSILKFRLR